MVFKRKNWKGFGIKSRDLNNNNFGFFEHNWIFFHGFSFDLGTHLPGDEKPNNMYAITLSKFVIHL